MKKSHSYIEGFVFGFLTYLFLFFMGFHFSILSIALFFIIIGVTGAMVAAREIYYDKSLIDYLKEKADRLLGK